MLQHISNGEGNKWCIGYTPTGHNYNPAARRSPPTAILYQNANKSITLLDIPASISLAQGKPEHSCKYRILSSPPLQVPYPSTEPKSGKAKANVLRIKGSSDNELDFPELLLRQALEEIAENWNGDWCLERKVWPRATVLRSKQPEVGQDTVSSAPNSSYRSLKPTQSSSQGTIGDVDSSVLKTEPVVRIPQELLESRAFSDPLMLSADALSGVHPCSNVRDITNKLVYNPRHNPIFLQYSGANYRIPPGASFIHSNIGEATVPILSMAALTVYPQHSSSAGPGQFDFILLDPPWENRSVKRAAKYETMRGSDPIKMLRNVLGQHIAPGGLMACWVTNNARVRESALEAFAAWSVQIVEEWAWLKTTVHGVPVSDIGGFWRKPYEILLLGRADDGTDRRASNVLRKVIVAVADLHSRKPNLKILIEPMVPANYRALEIFGRSLTAGWWTWGNEVLKFNWEGYWQTV